ncbi:MAG: enolase C-terminal domain-like protein [Candidatus Bathyarchaeia archaeon]
MFVTKVEAFKVKVPFLKNVISPALNADLYPHYVWETPIVRVHTDEGITGIGESTVQSGADQVVGAVQACAGELVGKDPLEFNLQRLPFSGSVAQPLEHALYDIAGKALGQPVCRLLGGRYRSRVPIAYWSTVIPVEATVKEARRAAELGFKVHKLKARPWNIVEIAERVMKEVGSGLQIRVDPNTLFNDPATAAKLAQRLEPYSVECFEDPVPKENMDWYRLLRLKTSIPQGLHLGRPEDLLRAVKAEAVDCVNLSGLAGSVLASAAIADAAGVKVWTQVAGLGLGVSEAFAVHVAAALRNEPMPCDELHFLREDDLIAEPLEVKDGYIEVPSKPGLGVELDEKALAKFKVD